VETQEAIKFIRALADGLNPETGQSLPGDSVCRCAQAVKALNRAVAALTAQKEREQNRPTNAGRYWSSAEDTQVCEEVRKGMDFKEIAKAHNRTVPAIVARLVKLGKIVPEKAAPKKSGPLFPPKVA
jgi:DNA-binding NarL/FixJ family response regulator